MCLCGILNTMQKQFFCSHTYFYKHFFLQQNNLQQGRFTCLGVNVQAKIAWLAHCWLADQLCCQICIQCKISVMWSLLQGVHCFKAYVSMTGPHEKCNHGNTKLSRLDHYGALVSTRKHQCSTNTGGCSVDSLEVWAWKFGMRVTLFACILKDASDNFGVRIIIIPFTFSEFEGLIWANNSIKVLQGPPKKKGILHFPLITPKVYLRTCTLSTSISFHGITHLATHLVTLRI